MIPAWWYHCPSQEKSKKNEDNASDEPSKRRSKPADRHCSALAKPLRRSNRWLTINVPRTAAGKTREKRARPASNETITPSCTKQSRRENVAVKNSEEHRQSRVLLRQLVA